MQTEAYELSHDTVNSRFGIYFSMIFLMGCGVFHISYLLMHLRVSEFSIAVFDLLSTNGSCVMDIGKNKGRYVHGENCVLISYYMGGHSARLAYPTINLWCTKFVKYPLKNHSS